MSSRVVSPNQAGDAEFKAALGEIVDLDIWAAAKDDALRAKRGAEAEVAALQTELGIRKRDLQTINDAVRKSCCLHPVQLWTCVAMCMPYMGMPACTAMSILWCEFPMTQAGCTIYVGDSQMANCACHALAGAQAFRGLSVLDRASQCAHPE